MGNLGAIKEYISRLLTEKPDRSELFRDTHEFLSSVKTFKDNEVLLHALVSSSGNFRSDSRVKALIGEEEKVFKRTLEHFSKVTNAFNKNDLRFFPMKSFRSYKYVDDDIDLILVDPEREEDYVKALEGEGFSFEWNRSMLREPHKKFYVKRDNNAEELLPRIHVHLAVSWNGIKFFDAKELYSRLKPIEVSGVNIPYPSPEDDLLIMAAHSVSENTYITAGELLHIKKLVEKNNIDIKYIAQNVKSRNWKKGFKKFLGIAEESYRFLTSERLFPESFQVEYGRGSMGKDEIPPYFFKGADLANIYTEKFIKDLFMGKLGALPREAVTFGLVIWLFRYRKRKKFLKF